MSLIREDEQPHHALQQAHHKTAFDLEEAHHQGGQDHEQTHGQGRRQDHRHGHGHVPRRFAHLLGKPFFKLCRFLHLLPQQLGAAGGDPKAPGQGFHKGVHAPDHGPCGKGPLLMLVFALVVFGNDGAVALAHSQGGAVLGVLHHDPLHDGLSAHGTSLHRSSSPRQQPAGHTDLRISYHRRARPASAPRKKRPAWAERSLIGCVRTAGRSRSPGPGCR